VANQMIGLTGGTGWPRTVAARISDSVRRTARTAGCVVAVWLALQTAATAQSDSTILTTTAQSDYTIQSLRLPLVDLVTPTGVVDLSNELIEHILSRAGCGGFLHHPRISSGGITFFKEHTNSSGRDNYGVYIWTSGCPLPSESTNPFGPWDERGDTAPDISGSRLVFQRTSSSKSSIQLVDAGNLYGYFSGQSGQLQSVQLELAYSATAWRALPAIGGDTVAWMDYEWNYEGEIVAYDLMSTVPTRLTTDALGDSFPAVSADGSVIVWVKSTATGPQVWQATRPAGVWMTSPLMTWTDQVQWIDLRTQSVRGGVYPIGLVGAPDTNGQVIVYSATRTIDGIEETDIYWQPVGGGVERRLVLAGSQVAPSISGNVVAFVTYNSTADSDSTAAKSPILHAFDLSTSVLYSHSNTWVSTVSSRPDIHVSSDGVAQIVYEWYNQGNSGWGIASWSFRLDPPPTLIPISGWAASKTGPS
jgi:hypothetical protein